MSYYLPLENPSLRSSSLDLSIYSTIHERVILAGGGLLFFPLLGRLALGSPGMDGSDLLLQRRIDGAMPL